MCVCFSGLYHALERSGKESGVGLKLPHNHPHHCPYPHTPHITIPPPHAHSTLLPPHTKNTAHHTSHMILNTDFPNHRRTALTGCRMLQGSCQAAPCSSSERVQGPPRGSESFQDAEIGTIFNCRCRSSMAPTHVCTAPAVLCDLKATLLLTDLTEWPAGPPNHAAQYGHFRISKGIHRSC